MGNLKFYNESGFCSHCGSILPLPGATNHHTQCKCGYKRKCEKWTGMVLSDIVVVVNELQRVKEKQINSNLTNTSAPTIERICSKCGHNKMTYKTQQLRSVDEGMSIFYCCVQCNSIEKEDS